MGISGVYAEVSSWQSREHGAQIDLLIDRRDHIISVCEIKFSKDPYVINKAYRGELERKLTAFRLETQTRKTVFLTLISTFGLQANQHSIGFVQNVVTMNDLFG
ncbi:ATPase [Parapedobacter deserti]|uniref:ATPase n=1 Tax=Parapedobacter deserti TaxID=1912957 RepID=A0ABV7JJM7_9SPHI